MRLNFTNDGIGYQNYPNLSFGTLAFEYLLKHLHFCESIFVKLGLKFKP
jgi:hypothetical protein